MVDVLCLFLAHKVALKAKWHLMRSVTLEQVTNFEESFLRIFTDGH